MKDSNAKIQEELQAVRTSYVARLPDKLEEIDTQWNMLSDGEWDPGFRPVGLRVPRSH
jgi:hypothetical protein